MEKKWIVSAVVVIVLAAAVLALQQVKKPVSDKKSDSSLDKGYDPAKPNFVMGSVVAASSDKIEFKAATEAKVAQLTSATKLVKQVSEGASIKVMDAAIADFKAGTQIVVYFSVDPTDNVYKADKIQIIGK